ncbi:cytochrome c-type biogenesis protein [Galdieria sulphuraria]|uniref:Cytochrome c-type biogenesis protein n=1 Tax=Galdieria sulphuraria TaxID=130081 RepID=M2W9D7_GALSU|nr:cytochrome c-type biogenesis protein [Galdieria sulphuraria]EME32496.1 cytochrome c-type biogenesis protein [Galdieria sulphuraria]|eukprot:XP_005709016.1 cytochrome c-type biogenesis protein [Galdieria sulphuraria]
MWQWLSKLPKRKLWHKTGLCIATLTGLESLCHARLYCEDSSKSIQEIENDFRVKKAILESRAKALYQQIRCLECGNGQTIEYSGAPSANEIRQLVWDLLVEGHSEEDIKGAIEVQYGHQVWMTPPLDTSRLFEFSIPFFGIAVCLGLLYFRYFAPKSPRVYARQLAKVDIETPYIYERRLMDLITPPGRK